MNVQKTIPFCVIVNLTFLLVHISNDGDVLSMTAFHATYLVEVLIKYLLFCYLLIFIAHFSRAPKGLHDLLEEFYVYTQSFLSLLIIDIKLSVSGMVISAVSVISTGN